MTTEPDIRTEEDRPFSGRYVLDDQVGYLLRLASQRHSALFLENTIHDLTPTQFAALVRLAERGECSQNELGRQTAMDVATIKGVIDRLRRKGLVEIRLDPDDRRRTLLSISKNHPDLPERLRKMGHVISRATLKPLTPDEREVFLDLLGKLG